MTEQKVTFPNDVVISLNKGEHQVIIAGGTMYVPALPSVSVGDAAPSVAEAPRELKQVAAKKVEQEAPKAVQEAPAEKEISKSATPDPDNMTSEELLEFIADTYPEVDIDAYAEDNGVKRRTAKFYRDLLTDIVSGKVDSVDHEAASANDENFEKAITEIFNDGAEEKYASEEDMVEALVNVGVDKAYAKEVVSRFFKDVEVPVEDFINEVISGESSDSEDVAEDVSEESSEEENAGEIVQPDELKEGDEVSVYWKSEAAYFDGVVTSVTALRGGRKKVMVKYHEDGAEEVIDTTEMTEIRRF